MVTVLGTVARTGLSGALIGNTAEVVLDALESDVLVLKPDDICAHLEELVKTNADRPTDEDQLRPVAAASLLQRRRRSDAGYPSPSTRKRGAM